MTNCFNGYFLRKRLETDTKKRSKSFVRIWRNLLRLE